MFRIIQNLWFDRLRSRKVRGEQHDETALAHQTDEHAHRLPEVRDTFAHVSAQLDALRPEHREVLILVAFTVTAAILDPALTPAEIDNLDDNRLDAEQETFKTVEASEDFQTRENDPVTASALIHDAAFTDRDRRDRAYRAADTAVTSSVTSVSAWVRPPRRPSPARARRSSPPACCKPYRKRLRDDLPIATSSINCDVLHSRSRRTSRKA